MEIEVLFAPAEFAVLAKRDLSATTCVVFDVLRATSSMLTALNNGAASIVPVSEIGEAVAVYRKRPEVLLAGERDGVRIRKEQTGSVDFDFGNSPRDFTPERVADKTIVWTTTNGTRALRACAHAQMILVAALLNVRSVADILDQLRPARLLLVCSGTYEDAAYEDIFGAGALIHALENFPVQLQLTDSAHVAHAVYAQRGNGVLASLQRARNARRLLAMPELAEDVRICAQQDSIALNAALMDDGSVQPLRGFGAKLA